MCDSNSGTNGVFFVGRGERSLENNVRMRVLSRHPQKPSSCCRVGIVISSSHATLDPISLLPSLEVSIPRAASTRCSTNFGPGFQPLYFTCCFFVPRAEFSPNAVAADPTLPHQAHGSSSIDDQAARQLEEISQKILLSVAGRPVADEDLKTWTANLRNLRLHTREDVQHIVEESNQKVLEAVANARADQSAELRRCAGELLQAMTNLGTSQSAGQRWLAREVAGLTVRIPRHAVLLPPREDESADLTNAEREASSWIQRLRDWRARGKRGGKGVVSKEYRLFFLCGHDGSLAECGFEGKGYRIKCLRTWVKTTLPFAKALLIVVNATLKAFVGLSIPADGIASSAGKGWDEVLSSTVEGATEGSIDAACSMVGVRLDEESAAAENFDEKGLTATSHDMGNISNVSSNLCFWTCTFVLEVAVEVSVHKASSMEMRLLPQRSQTICDERSISYVRGKGSHAKPGKYLPKSSGAVVRYCSESRTCSSVYFDHIGLSKYVLWKSGPLLRVGEGRHEAAREQVFTTPCRSGYEPSFVCYHDIDFENTAQILVRIIHPTLLNPC